MRDAVHREFTTMKPRRRRDIQGMRAIAVLLVVAYHVRPDWIPGGFVGVDIFFVISGFLITSGLVNESLATGRVDIVRFWGRRVRRHAGSRLSGRVCAGLSRRCG